MAPRLVGLIRVSTDRQGRSGLGLEAQLEMLRAYAASVGGTFICEPYTEVESGTHDDLDDRPTLKKAIAHARRANATLVIAKIDRLLRSTVAHAALKTSKVKFVACDNPEANELTLDILVAVAANETRQISDRTTQALARAKARGVKLGTPANLTDQGRARGRARAASRRLKAANAFASDLGPVIRELDEQGKSLREIATHLNAIGYRTARGAEWCAKAVSRVLERFGEVAA